MRARLPRKFKLVGAHDAAACARACRFPDLRVCDPTAAEVVALQHCSACSAIRCVPPAATFNCRFWGHTADASGPRPPRRYPAQARDRATCRQQVGRPRHRGPSDMGGRVQEVGAAGAPQAKARRAAGARAGAQRASCAVCARSDACKARVKYSTSVRTAAAVVPPASRLRLT